MKEIAADYSSRFGLAPRSIRVADFANGWGSCGAEGNILINWHLVFAPKKVLEYVIAHEVAHLRHRSHGPPFWDFLRTIAPDFEASKAWLDANQGSLSAEFLGS
ncbi:M48 family metallopeptidase [Mesorhizobium sp. M0051]